MSGIFEEAVRDETVLRAALAEADIAPLLMVLVQLTGDMTILDKAGPHIHGAWSFLEAVPEELKQQVRDRLVAALKDYAATGRPLPPRPPADTLQRMMSAGVGQMVAEEYIPLLIEETRFGEEDTRSVRWQFDPTGLRLEDFRVVVIAGVTSWYKNRHNRVTVTSPWRLLDYWRLTRHFVPEEYRASRPGHGPIIPGQEAAVVSSIERLTVG